MDNETKIISQPLPTGLRNVPQGSHEVLAPINKNFSWKQNSIRVENGWSLNCNVTNNLASPIDTHVQVLLISDEQKAINSAKYTNIEFNQTIANAGVANINIPLIAGTIISVRVFSPTVVSGFSRGMVFIIGTVATSTNIPNPFIAYELFADYLTHTVPIVWPGSIVNPPTSGTGNLIRSASAWAGNTGSIAFPANTMNRILSIIVTGANSAVAGLRQDYRFEFVGIGGTVDFVHSNNSTIASEVFNFSFGHWQTPPSIRTIAGITYSQEPLPEMKLGGNGAAAAVNFFVPTGSNAADGGVLVVFSEQWVAI